MKSMKRDTLAYQLGVRPLTQLVNREAWPLSKVAHDFNRARSKGLGVIGTPELSLPTIGQPEQDALLFYLLNHSVSLVRQRVHPLEPLGEYLPIVEAYNREIAIRSQRMFYYLLAICTRESRHNKASSSWNEMIGLRAKYGNEILDFHYLIKGTSSSAAVEKFTEFQFEGTLGPYTKFLAEVFRVGNYSSGYGGVAWAVVAEVLRDYVSGVLSAEMMMDTAFTLAHNNGPIFNKGMFFKNYSSTLYKILDVQRSGQIPQLIPELDVLYVAPGTPVRSYWESGCQLFPEFKEGVDWHKVEALGAKNKYSEEKANQKKKPGFQGVGSKPLKNGPSLADHLEDQSQALKKAKAQAKAKLDAEYVEVYPGFNLAKEKVR